MWTDSTGEYPSLFQGNAEGRSIGVVSQLEDDDVRLHGVEVEVGCGVGCDGFGEQAGVRVIFHQAGWHLLQSYKAGGGENSGLAHTSTQRLAMDSRLVDRFPAAYQHGAYGCAEPLGEAEHHCVEAASQLGDADAEGGGGVEDAGTIQMHGQAGIVRAVPDLLQDGEGGHRSAGHVMRVFEADEAGLGAVVDLRPDGLLDVRPR